MISPTLPTHREEINNKSDRVSKSSGFSKKSLINTLYHTWVTVNNKYIDLINKPYTKETLS